jgi:UDP-GlcNAc:undecaprenyl-phosphate/decaprenyl-phosphate GlcNAc-1-phosphate transferase
MVDFDYIFFFLGLCISFSLLTLLYFTRELHLKLTSDTLNGFQKIHQGKIIRIGGIVTIPSYFFASCFSGDNKILFFQIVFAFLPAFFFGLKEDLYKNVSPLKRLIGIILTATFIVIFLKIQLKDLGLFKIDNIILITVLTILAITTMANALNIIDGLNGLSIGTTLIILFFIFLLAFKIQDILIINLTLFLIFPYVSILVFNFPFAKIFSGDAGAYIMGCSISIAGIMVSENNISVNPFTVLLMIIYPLYECIRSFIRRLLLGKRIDHPDDLHLHSLLFKLFLQKKMNSRLANPCASVAILTLPLFCCLWAIINYQNQNKLIVGIIIFLWFYEFIVNKINRVIKK